MNQLIVLALESRDMSDVERFPRVLMTDEEKEIVDWVDKYRFKYHELPTIKRLAAEFPTLSIATPKQKIGILETAITRRKSALLNRAFAALSNANLMESIDIIKELNELLAAEVGGEINMRYFNRENHFIENEKIPMFTSNISDAMGGGLGRGEMAVIIGAAGVGKSMAVIDLATSYMLRGQKVLLVSVDMSTQILLARIDASLLRESAQRIRSGELKEDKRFVVLQHIVQYIPGEIIIPDDTVRSTNQISAMLKKHDADVLIVDGLYLLRSSTESEGSVRSWKNVAGVSEELKTMAQTNNIPVIVVSQANRQGEVGYSLALMQECDALLTLKKSDIMLSGSSDKKIITVEFLKNRNGPLQKSTIVIDFEKSSIDDGKIGLETMEW